MILCVQYSRHEYLDIEVEEIAAEEVREAALAEMAENDIIDYIIAADCVAAVNRGDYEVIE
jgi:hypothetical protein